MKIGPERTERFGESGKAKSSEGEGIGAKTNIGFSWEGEQGGGKAPKKKKKKKKKSARKKKKKGDLEG
jgi:hypothetical protein